jgi:hypothetical protein
MIDDEYEVVANGFTRVSDVPKDDDLFYRCTECDSVIPSVPDDNIGCECGNVFIDKDYWRLVVVDLAKMEVVKKRR